MRNLWLVFRREFLGRIRTGGYVITTVLMTALVLASTLIPVIMGGSDHKPVKMLLLDRTGQFGQPLKAWVANPPQGDKSRKIELEEAAANAELAQLEERARKENILLVTVDGVFPDDLKVRAVSGDVRVLEANDAVFQTVTSVVTQARIQHEGLQPEVVMRVLKPIQWESTQLTESGGRTSEEFIGSISLAMALLMSVFVIVMISGTFVFQGVLEEKVSRVMEVMAASVRPSEMLAGKILGLGALGLIQFLLIVGAQLVGNRFADQLRGVVSQSISLGVGLLAFCILVLTFALNSTMMAATASTISRMEDQQTVMMPVSMVFALPLMFSSIVMFDPNGTVATVMSLIPFFAPIMLMRVVLTDVPAWQIITSVTLLLLTTVGATWASGRIYRAAMLSYGGRPSLKQVWQYLRVG